MPEDGLYSQNIQPTKYIVTCGPFLGSELTSMSTWRFILGKQLVMEHVFHGYEN
jgi:hypothetical protein